MVNQSAIELTKMSQDLTPLPPGWEAKFDSNSGKTYYVNHTEKKTYWDHPCKGKKLINNNTRTSSVKFNNGSSKNFMNKAKENISLQDLSSKSTRSPLAARNKTQESSFTNRTDTDEAVSKISAMFPTVSDAHIRLLMKNSRYMKSIFPKAEETLILEILSNVDNNIQKSSETLLQMGYEKKDSLKISQQKYEAKIKLQEVKSQSPKSSVVIPRLKSAEEKETVRIKLQNEYKDIPEQLINIALESTDFDKDKASDLLKSTTQDLKKNKEEVDASQSGNNEEEAQENQKTAISVSQSRQSLKSLLKSDKIDKEKPAFNRVIEENRASYKSSYLSNTRGANPDLSKGNDDKLLLEDYVKWHGPNPSLRKGPKKGLAKGPSSSLKLDNSKIAYGANPEFYKGPNKNLVKGSIFQQMKAVAVGGESRGK